MCFGSVVEEDGRKKELRVVKPIVDEVALVPIPARSLLKELANFASLHGGRRSRGRDEGGNDRKAQDKE